MMITKIFLTFFEISLSTTLIVLLLLLTAPLLNKRYAAKWKYWIWLFLAVRLILPVNGYSLTYAANMWENTVTAMMKGFLTDSSSTAGDTPIDDALTMEGTFANGAPENGFLSENDAPTEWHPGDNIPASGRETQPFYGIRLEIPKWMTTPLVWLPGENGGRITPLDIIAMTWFVVCLILFFLYLLSYGHCKRRILREGKDLGNGPIPDLAFRLSEELHIKGKVSVRIYESAASPMVIGFLKPILVLPNEQYSENELYFILKHELIHLKRHDVFFKLLLAGVSTLHWFNPIVWMMQREAAVDMELSCDERVVMGAGYETRRAYTETLMRALHKKNTSRVILSTQFYEGEGKRVMKKRFANILLRVGKKNGSIILVCAVVLTVSLGALIGCSTANTEDQANKNAEGESGQPDQNDAALFDGQVIPVEHGGVANTPQDTDDVRVFDEVDDGEVKYQTRLDGIYRLVGDNEEQIYGTYAGTDTQLSLFEGRLYFKTDHLYQEGALDWQDTTIRWIDLQTLETGDLQMVRKDCLISSFTIRQGIVTISYAYPDGVLDSHMLYISEDTAWNGKSILELSEAEKQQYGQTLTQTVLQGQNSLINVSNRVPNQNVTYLDMDGDGVSEEIVLEPWRNAGGEAPDEPLRYYRLRIGEATLETYGYSTDNTLRAFSLDGETLILAIYEDGPSADPLTHFYQYRDGQIVEVGSFETDILSCRLEPNGILSGAVFKEIANSDWIRINWCMGENGLLEEAPQEYYTFLRGNWVELCEDLPLHTEAGGGKAFTVNPQLVKFLQISADWNWLLLETEDGQQGWVHVVNFQVEELDKSVLDVFRGGLLAG